MSDNASTYDGTADLRVDLDAHDRLPVRVRRVIGEAPLKFGSVDVLRQWEEAVEDMGHTLELEEAFCRWLRGAVEARVRRAIY